jgi:uncharacterized repeat protein (TIGR03803 family)
MLFSFTAATQGSSPSGGSLLVRDIFGNLYGETLEGGNLSLCRGLGCGVVYKLTSAGTYSVLHAFGEGTDGINPFGGLVLHDGKLYGVTQYGGTGANGGTVFEITP